MKLCDFFQKENINAPQFAGVVGVKPQTVYRWLNGERTPDDDAMQRIFTATSGQVTPNDFYDFKPTPTPTRANGHVGEGDG